MIGILEFRQVQEIQYGGFPIDQLLAYYKQDTLAPFNSGIDILKDSFGTYDGNAYSMSLVEGKIGNAYDYSNLGTCIIPSLQTGIFNGSFSIAHWYKTTQTSNFRMIDNRGTGTFGAVKGFTIGSGGTSAPIAFDSGAGHTIQVPNSTWLSADGNWHLNIVTWNTATGTLEVFRDNAQVFTGTNANMIGQDFTKNPLNFGRASNGAGQNYTGQMDETGIALKVWDEEERNIIWNNGNGITI